MGDAELAGVVGGALLKVAGNVARHLCNGRAWSEGDACFRVDLRAAEAELLAAVSARLEALAAERDAFAKNLDAIVKVCGLAGIGGRGQTVLCRVKDLHAALGQQIERADRAEAERDALKKKVKDAAAYLRGEAVPDKLREALRQAVRDDAARLHADLVAERDALRAELEALKGVSRG